MGGRDHNPPGTRGTLAVSGRLAGLEGDLVGEEAPARGAPGQVAAELDRVELVALTVLAVLAGHVGPPGGSAEDEGEGSGVTPSPVRDHLGDDSPVVVGGQHEVSSGGPGQVDTVHPGVAGEDHVEQVPQRPWP